MEEKRKKFGIEMLPSLHKQLRAVALDRDVNLYEVVQEAIEAYLGKEAEPIEDGIPGPLRNCLRALSEILRSGNDDVIAAVKNNITVFSKHLAALRELQERSRGR